MTTEEKQQLKELIKGDLSTAFKVLKETLAKHVRFNDLLSLEGQFTYIQNAYIQGTLTNAEYLARTSEVKVKLFTLIDTLDQQTQHIIPPISYRKGKALYSVPNTMIKGQESRCIVKIALTEEMLYENLDFDQNIKLKNIKVSDTMQVELLDPYNNRNFDIRNLSKPIQLIEQDSATEWHFMVHPLREGEHELLLNITFIVSINGKEERKDFALFEKIKVVVEEAKEPKEQALFKEVDQSVFSFSMLDNLPEKEKNIILQRLIQKMLKSGSQGLMALLVLLALTVTGSVWAYNYYQHEQFWNKVSSKNTVEAYQQYLDQYPEGKYHEEASWKIARINNTRKSYHAYLDSYPRGRYIQEALYFLALLDGRLTNYYEYMKKYPQGVYSDEMLAIIDSIHRAHPPVLSLQVDDDSLYVNATGTYAPYKLEVSRIDSSFKAMRLKRDSTIAYSLQTLKRTPDTYYFTLKDSVDNKATDTLFVGKGKIEILKEPALAFKSDSVHLGPLYKGEIIDVTLPVTNISDQPILIKNIKLEQPTGGYRTDWDEKEQVLQPGEERNITIIVKTENKPAGFFSNSFVVNIGQHKRWKSIQTFIISGWVKTSITDVRDNSTYKITKIGNKIWFAENVRFDYYDYSGMEKNFSCNKDRSTRDKAFRWEEAVDHACPYQEWEIPTESDWENIFRTFGEFDIQTSDTTLTAYNEIVKEGSSRLNLSSDMQYWARKNIEGSLYSVISLNSNRTQIRVKADYATSCNYCRCVKTKTRRPFIVGQHPIQ